MNRYTNLTPAQFNPLSVQEIMMVPLGKQKMHEQQEAAMEELGIFDINTLQKDRDEANQYISDFRNRIHDVGDELLSQGYNPSLAKKVRQMARDRDAWLSNDGFGGQANNAFNAYQANAKAIMDNKDMNATEQGLAIQHALNRYTGARDGYNPFYGADTVNVQERAEAIAKQMTPQTIKRLAFEQGWTQMPDGTWRNGEVTTTKLPADVIAKTVLNTLGSDNEVMQYVNNLETIGGLNPGAGTNFLINAAMNAGSLYARNDYEETQDMKFPPGYNSGSEIDPQTGLSYNTIAPPVYEPNVYEDSTLAKIASGETKPQKGNKVATGALLGVVPPSDRAKKDAADYNAKIAAEANTPYSVEDFTPEETTKYTRIAEGMRYNGSLVDADGNLLDADLSNPDVIAKVAEHQEKYQNYRNDVVIVDDVTGGVGNYSTGRISKDANAVLNNAKVKKYNAHFMNPETGEVYNWNDMVENFNATDIKLVQGYADVDNNLPYLLENQKDFGDRKSEFASPQVVVIQTEDGDLANIYMTRDQGEMNTPRYQADIKLNDFFGKAKSLPEIPFDLQLGQYATKASYYPERAVEEQLASFIEDGTVNEQGLPNGNSDPVRYKQFVLLQNAIAQSGRGGVYAVEYDMDGDGQKEVTYKSKIDIQEGMYNALGVDYGQSQE